MPIDRDLIQQHSKYFIPISEEQTFADLATLIDQTEDWPSALVIVNGEEGIRADHVGRLVALLDYLGPASYTIPFASWPLLYLEEAVDKVLDLREMTSADEVKEQIEAHLATLDSVIAVVDDGVFVGYFVQTSAGSEGIPGVDPVDTMSRGLQPPVISKPLPDCPCSPGSHPTDVGSGRTRIHCSRCGAEWDRFGKLDRVGVCPG